MCSRYSAGARARQAAFAIARVQFGEQAREAALRASKHGLPPSRSARAGSATWSRSTGFTVVLLLRLTPPFTVLFVYLGAASSDAASRIHGEGMQPWHIAVLAVSTAAAVVLGSAISRLARRTLAGSSDVAAADC